VNPELEATPKLLIGYLEVVLLHHGLLVPRSSIATVFLQCAAFAVLPSSVTLADYINSAGNILVRKHVTQGRRTRLHFTHKCLHLRPGRVDISDAVALLPHPERA